MGKGRRESGRGEVRRGSGGENREKRWGEEERNTFAHPIILLTDGFLISSKTCTFRMFATGTAPTPHHLGLNRKGGMMNTKEIKVSKGNYTLGSFLQDLS